LLYGGHSPLVELDHNIPKKTLNFNRNFGIGDLSAYFAPGTPQIIPVVFYA
jgi:hypothetical protein